VPNRLEVLAAASQVGRLIGGRPCLRLPPASRRAPHDTCSARCRSLWRALQQAVQFTPRAVDGQWSRTEGDPICKKNGFSSPPEPDSKRRRPHPDRLRWLYSGGSDDVGIMASSGVARTRQVLAPRLCVGLPHFHG